jgi:Mn2+/Fe2+ NRAMP family transporter
MTRPGQFHKRMVLASLFLPFFVIPASLLTWHGLGALRTSNPRAYSRGRAVCVTYLVAAACWWLFITTRPSN